MTTQPRPGLLQRRWRSLLAVVVGGAAAIAARAGGLPPGLSSLTAWDAACLVFLATTLWMMARDDEATVRARAAYEDEGQTLALVITLSAVMASLAATVLAMREAKAAGSHMAGLALLGWGLSVLTLLLGWLVVQTVFTLRYAHRYFGDGDSDGEPDRGVKFPGEAPKTYMDFIYMAVCIGATAQVSDFNITTARYRQLVTQHALLAFFFNTTVLALGINILATLIGQ